MSAALPDPFSFEASPEVEAALPGPRTFTLWKPSQFLAYVPPSDAIILGDGLVERGKWASILGIGGLGKTRLALNLAKCQILGREWCGISTHGLPLRWMFLSNENGLRRYQTDFRAMLASETAAQRAALDAHLLVMALTDDEDGDLNTGSREAMARLAVTLRKHRPDVVILDPWADMVAGDENKTEDIVATLRTLRPIFRKECPGAAIIPIHHSRTGAGNVAQAGDNFNAGNFARGAKAFFSAMRAEIQIAPGDRDDPNKIVVACGKNSDGPRFAPRGVVFNPNSYAYDPDPSFNLESWRNDVSGQRNGKACSIADVVNVVRNLAPHPGDEATTAAIVAQVEVLTDVKSRTCKTRLADAVKAGYLRKGSRNGLYKLGAKPLPR